VSASKPATIALKTGGGAAREIHWSTCPLVHNPLLTSQGPPDPSPLLSLTTFLEIHGPLCKNTCFQRGGNVLTGSKVVHLHTSRTRSTTPSYTARMARPSPSFPKLELISYGDTSTLGPPLDHLPKRFILCFCVLVKP
jgi:hypothetical protein